jgi:hypothetical protein
MLTNSWSVLERWLARVCTLTIYAVDLSSQNVSENGRMEFLKENRRLLFSSMLQQVYDDAWHTEHVELAIRVAYEVFWDSGER